MKERIPNWIIVITAVGGLIGIVSIIFRLIAGMKITWLTTNVPWGMWVAFYIYFIGLSAGSFLFSTLIYVFGQKELEKAGRLALISAVIALLAGMLFVWIDLGHPLRVLNVFFHWNYTSVLAWEIMFYIFYIICMFAELWYLMRCDLATLRDSSQGPKRTLYSLLALGYQCPKEESSIKLCMAKSMRTVAVLGAIGIPLAIGVHGGTGAIFAVVKARPYWYSPIFPIIFLVSALVSGAGLMTFLYGIIGDKKSPDHPRIVRSLATWLILFLSIDIILLAAEFLVGLYGGIPDHVEVLHEIVFGPYWYMFWVGQVFLTMLLPILVYIFKRSSISWLSLAGLSTVVGIVSVRFNLVIPAFVVSPIHNLDKVSKSFRFAFHYFPSSWEWVSSIGVISLVTFLFLIAYKYLPIFDLMEVKEK